MANEKSPVLGERLPRPEEARQQQEKEAAERRKAHDTWSFERMRHEVPKDKP